jgi:hypothetical protein
MGRLVHWSSTNVEARKLVRVFEGGSLAEARKQYERATGQLALSTIDGPGCADLQFSYPEHD